MSVLDEIVSRKREEIAQAQRARPVEDLERRLADAPPIRDFVGALTTRASSAGIALIAEVKKASPSAGVIREDFDPVEIATVYAQHGAACISVLTDEPFFQGRLEYLTVVREAVAAPVMRKDFLLDPYQILEARVAGADCVLLIAECLDDDALCELYGIAVAMGMAALIEIFEPANLERVLSLEPPLVGVNNRNLKTFETKLEHTLDLADHVPDRMLLVSESGIRTHADVKRLQEAGVGAILVGESLMKSPDVGAAVDALLGTKRSMRSATHATPARRASEE